MLNIGYQTLEHFYSSNIHIGDILPQYLHLNEVRFYNTFYNFAHCILGKICHNVLQEVQCRLDTHNSRDIGEV